MSVIEIFFDDYVRKGTKFIGVISLKFFTIQEGINISLPDVCKRAFEKKLVNNWFRANNISDLSKGIINQ